MYSAISYQATWAPVNNGNSVSPKTLVVGQGVSLNKLLANKHCAVSHRLRMDAEPSC
jgi:hypothetical protein